MYRASIHVTCDMNGKKNVDDGSKFVLLNRSKKNMNASKPSERPPDGEQLSKRLGGNVTAKKIKKIFMAFNRVPQLQW